MSSVFDITAEVVKCKFSPQMLPALGIASMLLFHIPIAAVFLSEVVA